MKTNHLFARGLLLVFATLDVQLATTFAQGTAFTYQGRLNDAGGPASGTYDLRFAIYDATTAGRMQGSRLTNSATAVSNGLFTVTLDFGAGMFFGADRWLEVGVRTNGAADFITLSSRQSLTPAPYAVFANTASNLLGTLPAAQLTGSIPASQLSGSVGTAGNFTGSLNGDVTGPQGSTVVTSVGGASAASVAGGASVANAATSANTAGVLVKRDASGNFAAGTITAELAGNAATATTATNLIGSVSDEQLSANITRLNGTNLFTGTNLFAGVTMATNRDNIFGGTFIGDGGGLTCLNPARLSGPLALNQLPGGVLTNGASGVTLSGNVSGTFTGDGSGVTGVNLLAASAQGALTWTTNWSFRASTVPAGNGPGPWTAADVNGDGALDLIVLNRDDNTVSIQLNDGHGNIVATPVQTLSLPTPPWGLNSVVTGDVNGDGKVDLMICNGSSGSLIIYTNDGGGNFAWSQTEAFSGEPTSLRILDCDANGAISHLVCGDDNNDMVRVLVNDGSGNFSVVANLPAAAPRSVFVADVNRDGLPDLVVANSGFYTGALTVFTNAGGDSFGLATNLPLGDSSPGWDQISVTAADVNGDSAPDLISADWYSGTLSVALNDGRGNFSAPSLLPVCGEWDYWVPNSVVATDVNGDGQVDLVAATTHGLMMFQGDGAGHFTNRLIWSVGNNPQYVQAVTVDGGGRPAVLVCAAADDHALALVRYAGNRFAAAFAGDGAGLTGLNATSITSGTLPAAQLPANVALLDANQTFTGQNTFNNDVTANGNVTINHDAAVNGSLVVNGTLTANAFVGDGSGLTNVAGTGLMSRDGSSLTNLNAASLTGMLPPALLPSGLLTNGATAVSLAGLFYGQSFGGFYGDGSALYFLNAAQLASGIVPDARLSANVAVLNAAAQTFAGTNRFNGVVIATNANNQFTGTFSGDGSGLSNITAPVTGNGSGLTNLNAATLTGTAGAATNFTGALNGDVTGMQKATVVASVGGQTAADVATGAAAANAATSFNTANAIVRRNASGSFTSASLTLNGNLNLPVTTASAGIIYANGSPLIHAYGNDNFFAGSGAGNLTMTGSGLNTGIGYEALHNNVSGYYNLASGVLALFSNTTGSHNSASGPAALYDNTTGGNNTAAGFAALFSNTTGNDNSAAGYQALYANTNGYENTANGSHALFNNTSGFDNTANGNQALSANTIGNRNTANGAYALQYNTNGTYNTANGFAALSQNTIGSLNTANGANALFSNTTGNGNTANGVSALQLNTTGNNNTANGASALFSNTSGSGNTANGVSALQLNTTGNNNTANGVSALQLNTTGNNNTANGYSALYANTSGTNNTATGAESLGANTIGTYNTAAGFQSLAANTGGYFNTAIGCNALQSGKNFFANTAIGAYALAALTNDLGTINTAVGFGALDNLVSGFGNIAIGFEAGDAALTGDHNIYIGNEGSDRVLEDGVIYIGTDGVHYATILAGTVYANGGVELTSDRNMKENFKPVDNQAVLAKVAALPVTEWNYKTDQAGVQHIGPMAQDFQAAFGLAGPDDKHISVVDENGIALVAIQGLNQKLHEKDAEIQDLKQSVAELKALVQNLIEKR